uniref:tapasin-related protein-like n=1 Tax=Semicossyphus pulcher TaxID=241346 RepID=UPI0037E760D8
SLPLSGVQCVHQVSWLPCWFIDEHISSNSKGTMEAKYIHRRAVLKFGQKGDAPVYPDALTFLITGSKLELRRYLEGVEEEQMECELRRYSTQGIHVRWPVRAAHEYNRWFTCTLKHTEGLFTVTAFLRLPSDQPPSGQQEYHSWPVIEDREILTTTVTMVAKTKSPSVKAGLGSTQNLPCQFAVDHKAPNVTVEWYWQHRKERVKLFSHNGRTGQTQGSGVGMRSLEGGDASLSIPSTKMSSEGTYACSVAVKPLFIKMDISLHIEVAPRVSLNIGPTLSLQEGRVKRVICDAESYYPLDVEIFWYDQDLSASGSALTRLPKVLKNVGLSSHGHNTDMTYSLSAFLYLKASLKDSGRQFTCSVSHQSLRVPIKKSFILTVEEPSRWMFYLTVGFFLVALVFFLKKMLPYLLLARRKYLPVKPY